MAEDEDGVHWYQTKAVLSSARTTAWDVSVDFLRPALSFADDYGFDPVEAGRGGGVILIEISDGTSEGAVTYRYTDFDILAAIAEGFLIERPYKGLGRPAKAARQEATNIIESLRRKPRTDLLALPKKVFFTVRTPDDLLSAMGLKSEAGYGMFATRRAYRRVSIDADNRSAPGVVTDEVSALHYHIGLLLDAQTTASTGSKLTLFDRFEWIRRGEGDA